MTKRRPAKRALATALLLAAAFVVPGLVSYAAAPVVVTQIRRAFSVREVRVARGDVVRFTNADEFLHQIYVRSASFTFVSQGQEGGQSINVAFPTTGVFDMRCEIHPKMLLTVTVE